MLLNLEQAVEVIIGKGRFLFIRFYNFRNTHKRAIEIGSNQSIVVGKPVSHCVQDSCNRRSIRIGRQFARLAVNVWGVDPAGKTEFELANAFIDALASFIKEVGLPTTFAGMGIPADTDYKSVADSTVLTAGCCKRFTKEELLAVLKECR